MAKIEIDVTVKGLGPLVDALSALVSQVQGSAPSTKADVQPTPNQEIGGLVPQAVPTTQTAVPTMQTTVPTMQTTVPTMQTTVPTTQTTVPTTQTTVPTTAVPTTAVAQEFTIDQLSVAAAGLVNQGKQEILLALLTRFGVQTMVDLPKEQYGAFAQALKAEGAIL